MDHVVSTNMLLNPQAIKLEPESRSGIVFLHGFRTVVGIKLIVELLSSMGVWNMSSPLCWITLV
jgi:hypothetical protein